MYFKLIQEKTEYKVGIDWEHDVDAIMHIENQSARMEKNRFQGGSNEPIKMF